MSRSLKTREFFHGSSTSAIGQMLERAQAGMTDQAYKTNFVQIRDAIFNVWRKLRRIPPGPARAKLVHRKVDIEIEKAKVNGLNASCRMGCYACCINAQVHCTEDEADLIAGKVNRGEVRLDADAMKRMDALAAATDIEAWRALPAELRRCPFLVMRSCSIYEDRPFSCRKYFVASNPLDCESPQGTSIVISINAAEIVGSAAFNLDPGAPDAMAAKLKRRLKWPSA